jgi:hypothetical protein
MPVPDAGMRVPVGSHSAPPAVMVVFDKSGSMSQAADSTCTGTACATRISEARSWTTGLVTQLADHARWGLQIFPADNQCTASGSAQVLAAIPASPGAAGIAEWLQAVTPSGGTPTGKSLAFTQTVLPSDGAERIALLLTDGVPNCDIDNPVSCVDTSCVSTLGGTQPTMQTTNDSNFCIRGCLDQDATEATIKSATDMRVIVVAFGSDFATPIARAVADAMAKDGSGEPCAGDADCTNGTCQTSRCVAQAFAGTTAASLSGATGALSTRLMRSARCRYVLDPAPGNSVLSVSLDNAAVPAAQLSVSGDVAWLLGDACTKLIADPALQPAFSIAN